MKFNRFVVLALIALTVVAVGAMGAVTYRAHAAQGGVCTEVAEETGLCEDGHDDDHDNDNDVEEAPPADASVSNEDAIAIALEAYPDAQALETEYEIENGIEGWKVELSNGLELMIDPYNGEVLSEAQDTDDHNDHDRDGDDDDYDGDNIDATLPADASVSVEDATAIAQEAYPDAQVTEVEYEIEGGIEGWKVELDNGLELMIDPYSGEVLSEAQDAD